MSDQKGDLLSGQQFNPTDPTVFPYTQQQMPAVDATALVGTQGVEIIPTNQAVSEVKTFDIAATQAVLDALVIKMSVYVSVSSLELPDQLLSVNVTTNNTHSDGTSSHPSTQQGFAFNGTVGTSGSGSLNPRASATGSAAIMFDLQPIIKSFNRGKIQGTRYFFYMQENFTWAQLLTRLSSAALANATVLALPVFKPVAAVFTVKGQSVSINVNADTTVSASGGPTNWSASWDYGTGQNGSVELTTKTFVLPPTVHGAINLSTTSLNEAVSVQADASTKAIAAGPITVLTIPNSIGPIVKNATASVTPINLAATTPAAVPTSGLYVVDSDVRPYAFGRVAVYAEVVDFAYFA